MIRVKRRSLSSLAALVAYSGLVVHAEDPLSAAKRRFTAGDYAGVIRLFEANPALSADCDGMLLSGVARERLNSLDEALIDLQAASGCNPSNTRARTALGEAWLRKGDDQRALALFEGVLKEAPEDAGALSGAATLYLKHDLNQQAAGVLEKLVRLQPEVAKLHADLGAAEAGLNDYVKARESFDAALRIDPNNVSALMGLGHVELRTGHPDQAIRMLSRAATLDPRAFEPHFLLAAAWTEEKRYDEVIRECKEALRLGGKDPEIYYRLARAYRGAGNEEEGKKAMAQFTALRGKAAEDEEKQREATRLVEQAKAMVDANRLQEAIDLLERSRALSGSDPQLLFRLAGLYYDTQRFAQAGEDVEAAIAIAPSEWTYYYLAGLIDEKTGRLEEAAKRLSIAARLNPTGAELFNELGNVAMAQRNYSEAAREFDAAARLDQHEPAYETNARTARQLAGK
jgi:tetratricopeptide (TPR) repeat protein